MADSVSCGIPALDQAIMQFRVGQPTSVDVLGGPPHDSPSSRIIQKPTVETEAFVLSFSMRSVMIPAFWKSLSGSFSNSPRFLAHPPSLRRHRS